MGRREFLRTLGAGTIGAAGLAALTDPFHFARAAITPGQKGIYITDLRTATISGLNGNATIIRLDTNKGISGYGEARCEDTNALSQLATLKPLILGMNPTQVDKVFNAIKAVGNPTSDGQATGSRQTQATGAICAIEMACWDITGKVYNVPVWKLIGPKLRDRVRLYADTPQQTSISAMQSLVQARINLGLTWFKSDLQLTYLSSSDYGTSPETGLPYTGIRIKDSGFTKWAAYIAAYRSMIGAAPLSSDHYQNYNNPQYLDIYSSSHLADLLAGSSYQGTYGGWMEDIQPWWHPAMFGQVKSAMPSSMPLLTGEDMYTIDQIQTLVNGAGGGVAYIHPDQSTFGGIHQTRLAAIWAHTQGVRTAIHMSESPLSLICCAHIAAGIPDFLACEHHYLDDVSWYDTLFDGIEKPIVEKSTGCVLVPEGPGLGITPNAAAITARLASGGYFTQ